MPIRDFKDGHRFIDFAYIQPHFRIAIEIDGFGPHWQDITPDEFCHQPNSASGDLGWTSAALLWHSERIHAGYMPEDVGGVWYMKQALYKPVGTLLTGVIVGAVIVGAVWYGTFEVKNHGGAIAKVGNTPIMRTDFQTQMESAAGSQTLSQLVSNQLIEDGAKKYNITASQSDLKTALQNLEQQNNITSSTMLQAILSANHMTMADLNNNLKIQVLEQKLAERNITVSNTEIQNYYNQNKSQLAVGGKTPPLSAVKSQIVDAIKQSKAVAPSQLLANLAKEYPIQILDPKYSDVKTAIESPAPAPGAVPPGQ